MVLKVETKYGDDPREPWQTFSECSKPEYLDKLDRFLVDKGDSYRLGKAACAICEVRLQCLNYALSRRISYGLYGGKTPRERKALLKMAANEAEPLEDLLDE